MKSITVLFLLIGLPFLLVACGDETPKQQPVYEGMSIVKDLVFTNQNLSHNFKPFLNETQSEDTVGEIIDDVQPLEDEIEDLVKIEVIVDDEVKYYVTPNEVFTVQVHLSNPDDFEIQSFTLNGKKYSNYMFKEGSTMELLLLEVTAPEISGYIDYTIDTIKYIDGTEIKDVKMEGNKTIKAGIGFQDAPSFLEKTENISSTSISLDFDINDMNYLTEDNELSIYLSDGIEILDKKDLIIGNNKITFSDLEMGKTYEYGVVAVFDLVDGNELEAHWLFTKTFVTAKAFTFLNYQSTQTSITFDVEKVGSVGNINYFNLIDEATEQVVRKIEDTNTREITGLLSNHSYIVETVFDYEVNQQIITDSVKLKISTEAKTMPTISLSNIDACDSTINGEIEINDPDLINNIVKVDLYQGTQLISSNEAFELSFMDLSYYTVYTVKIEHKYDLNDGQGFITNSYEQNITTAPYFRFSDVEVLNTTAVSEGDTIILQANIDNPTNAFYSKVIVNGQEYTVSSASTQNKLRVEIVNNGQFSGGNIQLSIEEIYASIGGETFQIEVPLESTATVFINGNLALESIKFVDENFNKLNGYVFPDKKVYVMIQLDNPTGYKIDSIIIDNVDVINSFVKLDNNNYYYETSLQIGWNYRTITELSYSNEYNSKNISFDTDNFAQIYKVKSSIIQYISAPSDLLNMKSQYYYELKNDIDLVGLNWFGNGFNGVFDGNGYVIKNMSNVATYQNRDLELGLFIRGTGVITNIELQESTIIVELTSSSGQQYAISYGGFCALASDLILTNVSIDNFSSISINNRTDGNTYVGGLIGRSYGPSAITNSFNCGAITGTDYVGGLIGLDSGFSSITNSFNCGAITGTDYVGGLIGFGPSTIKNCYNSGAITGTYYTGGLIGNSHGIDTATITNSYNSGAITGINFTGGLMGNNGGSSTLTNSYNSGAITGINFTGGLIGNDGGSSTLTNSFNSGAITGRTSTGGLIGESYESCTMTNSFNSGAITGKTNTGGLIGESYESGTMTNSFNSGVITGINFTGGLMGFSYDSSIITNSYNSGSTIGINCTGGLIGRSFYSSTITNSFNCGEITGTSEKGGLIGGAIYSEKITITNSYSTNLYEFPVTKEQLHSKTFYTETLGWDETIWIFDNLDPVNNKYPAIR